MVFMRYVLVASTIWQTEFVLYTVVAATLLGSPQVLATGGHVSVDLIGQLLSPAARRWQQAAASLVGLIFVGVLTWSAWRYFYEAWEGAWVTESVWAPPLWLVLLPLPLGFGALTLQYIVDIGGLLAGQNFPESRNDSSGASR
jgi:TRAP-type C4-dicarboxylate transport system permease small subunit